MNVRRGLTSLFAFAFLTAGCGGGGSMSPGGAAAPAPPTADEDLPAWVLALPEGDPPRENDHTALAALYLLQASQAGDEARAREMYGQALEEAEAGLEVDPGNAQSYLQAGEAHLGLGNLAAAGEMFTRAEEIYPRMVIQTDYLRELAWIEAYNEAVDLMLGGTGADPEPALERANAIYRGRPEALIQLAALYTDRDRTDDAIELYLSAVDLINGPRRDRIEDPELLAQWDDAREVALFNVGALLYQEGRFAEAVEVYEQLQGMYPEDQAILNNLAASLVSAGDSERATAIYDALISRPGMTATEYLMVGSGLSEAGNDAQAARAFALAHELIPQDQQAIYNYAQALYFAALDQADSAQAVEHWTELTQLGDRLLAVDTHGRNAYQILATAHVRLDQQAEASQVLDQFGTLPFYVSQTLLGPLPDGVAVVGRVTNQTAASGSQARLRIIFYGPTGGQVGTEDVTLTLGAPEEGVDFQVDLITSQEVVGFRYEVLD